MRIALYTLKSCVSIKTSLFLIASKPEAVFVRFTVSTWAIQFSLLEIQQSENKHSLVLGITKNHKKMVHSYKIEHCSDLKQVH